MGAGGREERVVGVAAMQFSCTNDLETNVNKAERYLPTYQCQLPSLSCHLSIQQC